MRSSNPTKEPGEEVAEEQLAVAEAEEAVVVASLEELV